MNDFAKVISASKKLGMLVGLAAVLLPISCGSDPQPLPPNVASGLDTLRNEAVSLKAQTEKTTVALKDLMATPQADLTPQHTSYTQELARLEGRADHAQAQRRTTDQMVAHQFAAWDRDLQKLQSEESQKQAAARRSATVETYEGIQRRIGQLREQWTPFITDLRDLRQYFKSDLTPSGLATMKPTADRVAEQGDKIVATLDGIIASISEALARD